MVYICRTYGDWDFESNEENENCCEVINKKLNYQICSSSLINYSPKKKLNLINFNYIEKQYAEHCGRVKINNKQFKHKNKRYYQYKRRKQFNVIY